MITARHSGKLGDICFAIPCIKALGIEILYIPETTAESPRLYSNIKDLLLLQPYIKAVREYPSGLPYMELAPGIHIDYDLDLARLQPKKGVIHIVKRYLDQFHINIPNWKDPWLVVDDAPMVTGEYVVVNYTGRHIYNEQMQMRSKVDWKKVVESIKEKAFFVGTIIEHRNFESFAGSIEYLPTKNMLEVARVIRDAKAVYCNQSSVLAIAQGLSKPYYLDVKPQKLNCLLYTSQEHILR